MMSTDTKSRLDLVDRLVANAVLETTIDQLAIVGGTLPPAVVSYGGDGTGGAGGGAQHDVPMQHVNVSEKSLEEILPKEKKMLVQVTLFDPNYPMI
jgi:hypothetical protein